VIPTASNQESAAECRARQARIDRFAVKHGLVQQQLNPPHLPVPGKSVVPQSENECSTTSNVVLPTDEFCDRCKAILRKRKREQMAAFRAKLKRYKKEMDAINAN
jgi:hypothetical protein